MLRKSLLFIVAAVLYAATAVAGPFGLEAGMKVKEGKIIKKVRESLYSIYPPKPNSLFSISDYYGLITPVTGLCKVHASTDPNDELGGVRDFERIENLLNEKYKKGKRLDKGEIDNLISEVTTHKETLWLDNLPNDISSISLELNRYNIQELRYYVSIEYQLININSCIKELKDIEKSTL